MVRDLADAGYKVLALDGDASNPGGLAQMLLGSKHGPEPLLEFFGGRACVRGPVEDPSPLTRTGDNASLKDKPIHLDEMPPAYSIRNGNVTLCQVGKIREAYEGCDGPLSKITRDFVIADPAVTILDVEAGVEHFGRGIAINVDEVIVVVDPTYESISLAERVRKLCAQMDIFNVWAVLNKVGSLDTERRMVDAMNARDITILGIVHHDRRVEKAGIEGTAIVPCTAMSEVREITQHLESVSTQGHAAAAF
jgi:CO dehydrogenase maturation factor